MSVDKLREDFERALRIYVDLISSEDLPDDELDFYKNILVDDNLDRYYDFRCINGERYMRSKTYLAKLIYNKLEMFGRRMQGLLENRPDELIHMDELKEDALEIHRGDVW